MNSQAILLILFRNPKSIINGNIYDAYNKTEVTYGVLILENTDTSYFSVVDSLGFFQMQIPKGKYDIQISSAGYDTFYLKEIELKGQEVLNYQIYLGSHIIFCE